MGAGSRTALLGGGGDEVLYRSLVVELFGNMPLQELLADIARSVLLHRRRPAGGIRASLESWRTGGSPPLPPLPVWLNADLAARWDLRQRAEQAATAFVIRAHPLRPEAHRRLASPLWPSYLESVDPGVTRVPVEHQWPFLDLRLVGYLLAIPPLPWCVDKRLLRLAMRGSLPAAVLRRSKSPLASDPLRAHLQTTDYSWLDRFEAAPQLARFVNRRSIPPVASVTQVRIPVWICGHFV